jgi:hypothetical protein
MKEYKIIDNFLDKEDFLVIKNFLMSSDFPWYFQNIITNYENAEKLEEAYFFLHKFYKDFNATSNYINILNPIIQKLNPNAIIRINANLFPNINKDYRCKSHQDFEYSHKGAVFYVNTNNGYTVLEDGTKIESIENRVLLHDASEFHNVNFCTDEKTRVTLVFNYF